MKRKLIALIAVLLFLVAPAAAQQATPSEPTAPDGAPDEAELVVDENVALVDVGYSDGEVELEFYASDSTRITVAGEPGASEESGSFSMTNERLRANSTTTVSIASEGGASFWSRTSIADGDAYYVRKPSDALISGPWTGQDVLLVGIMASLGVAFAVVYGAVMARVGADREGGRVV